MKTLLDPAMTVAVLALVLTIYQAYLTRKHNRLSVRPFLDRNLNKARTPEGITFTYSVRNAGIGTAIIRDAKVYLDRSPVGDITEETIQKALSDCFGAPPKYQLRNTSLPGVNTALVPGQQICLAEIHFTTAAWQNNEREIENRFNRIDYLIAYESLYKVRGVLCTNPEIAARYRPGA